MSIRLLSAIALTISFTTLMGCSTLVKTKVYSSANYDTDKKTLPLFPDGVTYYLPKKYLKVVVTRKEVPTDKVKTTKLAAEEAKTELEKVKTKAKAAKEASELAAESAKSTSADGKKAADEKSSLLAGEYKALQDQAVKAEAKLKTLEEIANAAASAKDAIKYEDDITVTELPSVPDTSMMFVARLNHWVTHEDKLLIKTTKSGLLDTVTGEGKDKTPQILEDTGKVVIAAFKAAAGMPTPTSTLKKTMETYALDEKSDPWLGFMGKKDTQIKDDKWVCSQLKDIATTKFSHEFTFDPSEVASVSDLNRKLCQLATSYRVVIRPEAAPFSKIANEVQDENGGKIIDAKDLTDGLVYRSPIPYTIDLARVIESDVFSIKSSQVMLPNKGPISVLSMETGAFIATNYDIGFEDGMLTKLDIKRPSEVHSIVQVPLTLLREIIALPTDLIQLKVDYSSKETSLLESQKKNVDAQEALRKALKDQQEAIADQGAAATLTP